MPTLVSRPANTAVTGAGALGYESGSHSDIGKTAAFTPNATSSNACRTATMPSGSAANLPDRSAMLTVPVAA